MLEKILSTRANGTKFIYRNVARQEKDGDMGKSFVPYRPTKEDRQRVRAWVATGVEHKVIGELLDITQPTLRKHYANELRTGVMAVRANNLARLEKAADSGNVSAMKALEAIYTRVDSNKQFDAYVSPNKPEARVERLGKKAQAEHDAKAAEVGSEWEGLIPQMPATGLN